MPKLLTGCLPRDSALSCVRRTEAWARRGSMSALPRILTSKIRHFSAREQLGMLLCFSAGSIFAAPRGALAAKRPHEHIRLLLLIQDYFEAPGGTKTESALQGLGEAWREACHAEATQAAHSANVAPRDRCACVCVKSALQALQPTWGSQPWVFQIIEIVCFWDTQSRPYCLPRSKGRIMMNRP